MKQRWIRFAHAFVVLTVLPLAAQADISGGQGHSRHTHSGHTAMQDRHAIAVPSQGGQAAFAAIQEIVEVLRADPATDWRTVDVEALRQHLMDMDAVTLRSTIATEPLEDGARFAVTSTDSVVTDAIRRMVLAHAMEMSGVDGMRMQAKAIAGGARLTVTGPEPDMILGLGFIGLMTVGMHHQAHHLALARGADPHHH